MTATPDPLAPTHRVDPLLQLWNADVMDGLRSLQTHSVHTWMTSPPYFRLRDYGYAGQLGHEPTLREHIEALVAVFAEAWRVLHPSGVLWLNYGDAYAQHGRATSQHELFGHAERTSRRGYSTTAFAGYSGYNRAAGTAGGEFKRKQLMMIPHRLAIALQDAGWYVRADVVWSKTNALPESTPDRPSKTHEYVFMLTKREKYFYDQNVVREGLRTTEMGSWGRRLRTVWEIPTEPCKVAHYATFPQELVRRCILPTTSRLGCCPTCLTPVIPVYEAGQLDEAWQKSCGGASYAGQAQKDYLAAGAQDPSETKRRILRGLAPKHMVGARPGCACLTSLEEAIPCTVGDMFSGIGTVGKVALRNGFAFVGIEGSPTYVGYSWADLEPRARLAARLQGR